MNHKSLGFWTAGLYAVPNIPLVRQGDDVASLITSAIQSDGFELENGDVLVVAQKIVSKAEGATATLAEIVPSDQARTLSQATGRDPRVCEVYLRESAEILGTKGSMVITRHRLGFVCTCAGVDDSNVGLRGDGTVVLLPQDPDASAEWIRLRVREQVKKDVSVIVSDSFGRPDRDGAVGVAIGVSGIRHLETFNQQDLFGNPITTRVALVDDLAAAAAMLMGEANESRPAVVIRGIRFTRDNAAEIRHLLY